jgi:organic hydroperoxide reductase OsmC/OhrA
MRRDVVIMQTTTTVQHKSFTYRTFTEWLGGKAATFAAVGKPAFRVASPPEFRGEKDVWTPEDLFVGAIETCLLMTFSSIVLKQDLRIDAYYSEATGTLEFMDGQYRFTRVVVRPIIIVADVETVEPASNAIRQAHRNCLVANSLLTRVIVEPDIRLRDAA